MADTAARRRCKWERPFDKPAERVLRGVWFNPWRVGAAPAAKLASHRPRRNTGNRGLSLDHLVGPGEQRRRHVETKRPRLITRFVSLTIWLSSVVCRERVHPKLPHRNDVLPTRKMLE